MIERLKTMLRPFRIYRAARFGWHFARDPVFRRDHLLLWQRPKNLFQHRSITFPDRYPAIFEFIQKQLVDRPAPRLLSFGCAMGAEVFSLHDYFPSATIKGIDINPANIAAAQARYRMLGGAPSLLFEQNDSTANEPPASYDAVFCLAVFVRWQLKEDHDVATCAPHLHFVAFERTVTELAACVRPGGFLVLRHSMFRFADTVCARDFTLVLSRPPSAVFFPRFGRDNQRLPDEADEAVVFQKR